MPRADFRTQRLFVHAPLAAGTRLPLDPPKSHYLVHVLRMAEGARLLVFNGADGEWRAAIKLDRRQQASLVIEEQTRPQEPRPDLHYLFAPLKQARLDYMVQKAVELGVGRLRPVLTQHVQVNKLNRERMEANAIEAAEQCGVLALPRIDDPVPLGETIDRWAAREAGRRIVFCDEGDETADAVHALGAIGPGPLAVLIGPEGGFSEAERHMLRGRAYVRPISLGPRILRADTAAVAALSLVQAMLGDWRTSVPEEALP